MLGALGMEVLTVGEFADNVVGATVLAGDGALD
jgi:hypothetical protein